MLLQYWTRSEQSKVDLRCIQFLDHQIHGEYALNTLSSVSLSSKEGLAGYRCLASSKGLCLALNTDSGSSLQHNFRVDKFQQLT